jgi:hypothetical protein
MSDDMECACGNVHYMPNVQRRERLYFSQQEHTGTRPKHCADTFCDGKIIAYESRGDREEDFEEGGSRTD